MENFVAYTPTELHFGKDVTDKLSETVNQYGHRILLIYGKGSVKRTGVYDRVLAQLNKMEAEVVEYSGIKPNPVIEDVEAAVALGREKQVEAIVAVGGGSVIDSAKIVALCIPENLAPWEVMLQNIEPQRAVPLIAVLTLAATGTEMNGNAVLQNPATGQKIGLSHRLNYPKHSFLDPAFTFSVPPKHTTNGIVDLIAHVLESFFGYGKASLSDRFAEAIIKEAMHYAPLVLKEPDNYEYRAAIMWAATCALNGTSFHGRTSGDWGVHALGHTLSFLYDTPHGASLSIAYPAWLKLQKERIRERIMQLGRQLWDTYSADETIIKLEEFFRSINSPVRLQEVGIEKGKRDEIVSLMTQNQVSGINHELNAEDHGKLVDLMFDD